VTRPEPVVVAAARRRAEVLGFTCSSHDGVGRLLAVLAAAVPPRGRVLELGTGAGVGTAWIVEGLGSRDDVEVVSVEQDPGRAAAVAEWSWPPWVRLVTAEALEALGSQGRFDLVFADARGGKWEGLDRTIAALAPHGLLLVDDMITAGQTEEDARRQEGVRAALTAHPGLQVVELDWASGVILCAARSG
jgi:predicted O-methyltransferase YrrM